VDWILTEESRKFNTETYDINSAADLPFHINFDAIAMSGILEYATDPYSLMRRVASRIKPDGLLFISYINFNYISRIIRKAINKKTYLHPTWKNTLDFQLLRSIFEEVDLHVVKEMSVDLPLTHFGLHKIMGTKTFEKDFGDSLSKQKLFILKKGDVVGL
jgi:2-polyprenyl-3-methyl-5-hydroxy-6-metoxy-1,4-benzoquinol methylase